MEFCIDARQLRAALKDIEAAEANGFMYCLAVFKITQAGPMLGNCRAAYSDLYEKAHPTDGKLDWGRFQAVAKRHKFVDGGLVDVASRDAAKEST